MEENTNLALELDPNQERELRLEGWNSLLEEKKLRELKAELAETNEVDVAQFLGDLEPEKTVLVFRMLPKAISVDVFSYLPGEDQADIIQAITFHDPNAVIAFCQGIQAASPVDSFVVPEPWDMPGYDSPVIMAAGAFVSGASIELSADGPIREPYSVFFQGGLTFPHVKFGILKTLQYMLDKGLTTL